MSRKDMVIIMRIISHKDIEKINISELDCYNWVNEALLIKESAILPAKISLNPQEGVFYNVMPVILEKEKVAGVKLVNRYPGRIPSLDSQILLYNTENGEHLALLDGNWITNMRTGAVAAHSIKLFAKKDFSVLGYIGLGNTAIASLRVLLALYPARKFTIKLKIYKNQHELLQNVFPLFKISILYIATHIKRL